MKSSRGLLSKRWEVGSSDVELAKLEDKADNITSKK